MRSKLIDYLRVTRAPRPWATFWADNSGVPRGVQTRRVRGSTRRARRLIRVSNPRGLWVLQASNSRRQIRRKVCSSSAPTVKAVVFFGDVTHVANQTYNTANGTAKNGVSTLLFFS